jgi:hypothetical protein
LHQQVHAGLQRRQADLVFAVAGHQLNPISAWTMLFIGPASAIRGHAEIGSNLLKFTLL